MKRTCIQCGEEFELSKQEISLYEEKGLELPKRCYSCRRSNRIRNYDVKVPKGMGRRGRNYFGIGRAMPGMLAILLILAAFIFGRSFLSPDTSPAGYGSGSVVTASKTYVFRNFDLLAEHYEKHGRYMGYSSEEEYLIAANAVITDPASLHKQEKEDGDDVYYLEKTNDLVIVSVDGYIRTYFRPDDGIRYYNRQ